MIRITSKKDGFRRCGIVFNKKATEFDDDRFSAAELKALKGDPMLDVVVTSGGENGGGGTSRPNAQESISLVAAAETLEDLNKLAEGEDRKSVVAAIEKRRVELTKA